MRIALATDIPALGPGGLEVLVRELVCGLAEKHEVVLASSDDARSIESSPLRDHLAAFVAVANPAVSSANFSLADELSKHRVDVCHLHLTGTYGWRSGSRTHSPIPGLRRAGFRCFSTNHQATSPLDLSNPSPKWKRLAAYLRRLPGKTACLRSLEKEFLVSDHDLRLARTWFPHQAHKFDRIYHSALSGSPELGQLTESKTILNLATVCYRKGQHILVRAFAKIAHEFPDWRLRLVGSLAQAECISEIRRVIAQADLGNRVELAGPTQAPEDAILSAEVYVQPSLLEGLGLSLQEAMFHGRPCIGTRVGGIPELIDHDLNGLLVAPDDDDELAAALRRMLSRRDLREQMARAAGAAIPAKGMTREAMVERYHSLYRQPGL